MPITGADEKISGLLYDNGGAFISPYHPDYNGGAKGDGTTDDTLALQAAMNASRDLGIPFRAGGGSFRITSGLTSQYNGSYKANTMDWGASLILADFTGAVAFTILGGASVQRIRNLTIQPTVARRLASGGAYVSASTGILVSNAVVELEADVEYFAGDGLLISSTGANSNNSSYFVRSYYNGRGVDIAGTNDNLSMIRAVFKTTGNSKEGIRVEDTAAMRQWTGNWYAENNWASDPTNAANYGVYIGKATTCVLEIYSEQSLAASEIYAHPTNVTNSEILSFRRNKDSIIGTTCGRYGIYRYQTGDGNRRSTPRGFLGLNTRKANAGEWVDMTWEAGDGVIGRARGEANGVHLLSASAVLTGPTNATQGQGTSVGATDKFAYAGRKRIYTDLVPLSSGTQTRTIAICNVTSASVITGRLTVSGVSGGGTGIMTSVIDFRVDGTTLTANAAIVGSAATPNPSTAVLSVTSGVLQIVFTYVSAQWGASYSFDYSVEGTFINVT